MGGRFSKDKVEEAEKGLGPPAPQIAVAVMRHGRRLDSLGRDIAGMRTSRVQWADADKRPWDTPIDDPEGPAAAAAALQEHYRVVCIISSPFRRCLQTAGQAALACGLGCVRVHNELGEVMYAVRKSESVRHRPSRVEILSLVSSSSSGSGASSECELPNEERSLPLLSEAEMRALLPPGVTLDAVRGAPPRWEESPVESLARLRGAINEARAWGASDPMTTLTGDADRGGGRGEGESGGEGGGGAFEGAGAGYAEGGAKARRPACVLVVSHGDALRAAVKQLLGREMDVREVEDCACVAFDARDQLTHRRGAKVERRDQ